MASLHLLQISQCEVVPKFIRTTSSSSVTAYQTQPKCNESVKGWRHAVSTSENVTLWEICGFRRAGQKKRAEVMGSSSYKKVANDGSV